MSTPLTGQNSKFIYRTVAYLVGLAQFNLAYTHSIKLYTKSFPTVYDMLGFCRGINVLICQILVFCVTLMSFTSEHEHLNPVFNNLIPFQKQNIRTKCKGSKKKT